MPSKTVATAIVRHVQVPCKVPRKAKGTGLKTGQYKTGKSCAAKNGGAKLRSPASRVGALKNRQVAT